MPFLEFFSFVSGFKNSTAYNEWGGRHQQNYSHNCQLRERGRMEDLSEEEHEEERDNSKYSSNRSMMSTFGEKERNDRLPGSQQRSIQALDTIYK